MKCLVCLENIKLGEQIFWGNQVECCGDGESDCIYSEASSGLVGCICLSCLKSPPAVPRTANTMIPEPVETEAVVQRSDALAIFDGVEL